MSSKPETEMNEVRARAILEDDIKENNGLYNGMRYIYWNPGDYSITLDGEFGIEELEAIVWWMRNKNTL